MSCTTCRNTQVTHPRITSHISATHASSLVLSDLISIRRGIRNRPEPDAETNYPNRTRPSHAASEKRRLNRVEPGNINFRTEPNRTDSFSKSPEPKRIEPNRFLPDRCWPGATHDCSACALRAPRRRGRPGSGRRGGLAPDLCSLF